LCPYTTLFRSSKGHYRNAQSTSIHPLRSANRSECPFVNQHLEGCEENPKVAQHAPVRNVLQIGLQPVGQITLALSRSAEPSDLRQTCQARFERVPPPVMNIDFPKQLVPCERSDRMRARPNQTHLAAQHIEELRKLVETGLANQAPDPRDP